VIEGASSIVLNSVDLSSEAAGKWGVMIYQSMSGDAQGTQGTFTMTGGSLAAADGPLFFVTNSIGVITLKGVDVTAASGILLKVAGGNWGNEGSNGGTAVLTADGQAVSGNLVADSISRLSITLQNGSSLSGAMNADDAAKVADVTLDATSTWNVAVDSYLTSLTLTGGISGSTIANIAGNGHTVYYDASNAANGALGGQTYSLSGGGALQPAAWATSKSRPHGGAPKVTDRLSANVRRLHARRAASSDFRPSGERRDSCRNKRTLGCSSAPHTAISSWSSTRRRLRSPARTSLPTRLMATSMEPSSIG
jgi:hypothetical protein